MIILASSDARNTAWRPPSPEGYPFRDIGRDDDRAEAGNVLVPHFALGAAGLYEAHLQPAADLAEADKDRSGIISRKTVAPRGFRPLQGPAGIFQERMWTRLALETFYALVEAK